MALIESLIAPPHVAWPDSTPQSRAAFLRDNPAATELMTYFILKLGAGEIQWREAIGFSDWDLVEMANMVMAFIVQGRFAQAEEAFGSLCDLSPSTPLFWLEYGDIFEEQRKLQEAAQAYAFSIQLAEQMNPPLLDALIARVHRGAVFCMAEIWRDAARDFLDVLCLDPEPLGERCTMAAMGLQALLNDGRVKPEELGLANGSPIGQGWSFTRGQLQPVVQGGVGRAGGMGGRLFTSSQAGANIQFNPYQFRAEQNNSPRTVVKFVNLVRPHFKREVARGQMEGMFPSSSPPQQNPEIESGLAFLRRRPYGEIRGAYHTLARQLVEQGRLGGEQFQEISLRSRRLFNSLRGYYRHRALTAQIDRYRSSQSVQPVQAMRFRTG